VCITHSTTIVFPLQHCEKLLFNLDEMGHVNVLLDELGVD